MSFWKLSRILPASSLLAWALAGAQQSPPTQTQQSPGSTAQSPSAQSPASPASPTTTENPAVSSSAARANENMANEKMKHWTGSLVDANCMAKTLGDQSGAMNPAANGGSGAGPAPSPQAPHFTSEFPDQLQQAGQAGAGSAGAAGRVPNPAGTAPTYPGQDTAQSPGMSQAQSAQSGASAKVDSAVKQCTASTSTQQFALATSGGQVIRFDSDGNTKADQAMKSADVQPGKKVKAKVTGAMEGNNTVKVASVEIKGKKINPSSMTGRSGAE